MATIKGYISLASRGALAITFFETVAALAWGVFDDEHHQGGNLSTRGKTTSVTCLAATTQQALGPQPRRIGGPRAEKHFFGGLRKIANRSFTRTRNFNEILLDVDWFQIKTVRQSFLGVNKKTRTDPSHEPGISMKFELIFDWFSQKP